MSSKNIDEKSIKEALECPICKDLFMEPKQLECGHTYCLECVDQLDKVPSIVHQIVGEDFFDTLGVGPVSTLVQTMQNNVQCPQCRKMCLIPERGLNTNYALKDMVDQFRATCIADFELVGEVKKERVNHMQCQSCFKIAPESEMYLCKDCRTDKKPISKQCICAVCGMDSHKPHTVVKFTELASTHEREQAALQIEAIGSKAQELAEQTKFIQNDLQKGFEGLRKKLMIKLNQLQLLQIECYDTDVNPLKEDVEGRVREATRQCEQLNKSFSQLHKLKLDVEGQLKQLDHNVDIAFAANHSSFLRQLCHADQPSTSSNPHHQNHFAYNIKDGADKVAKARRLHQRRHQRTRRVSSALTDASSSSPLGVFNESVVRQFLRE